MSNQERKTLIEKIQEKNGSKVLTYFLSDRETVPKGIDVPGIKHNIDQYAKTMIYDALTRIGHQERLDLFIYTRGGDTNAVWPIVSLLREFCNELQMLIPFKNHSGGTMIGLGADKIIMSKMGELSPIDPTTGNQFNPIDEVSKRNRKGISVEDLNAYFQLARDGDSIKLKDNEILDVFKELTKVVHPLALGNVNRVLSQIKSLSSKLLSLHLNKEKDGERIKSITDALTTKFFSHLHFINRKEALKILGEDIIVYPDEELESMMMELLDSYATALNTRHDFCCFSEMGDQNKKEFSLYSALIENDAISYVFKTDFLMYQRSELPPNMQISLQPGQVISPIIQGLPKSFYWEICDERWIKNQKEV